MWEIFWTKICIFYHLFYSRLTDVSALSSNLIGRRIETLSKLTQTNPLVTWLCNCKRIKLFMNNSGSA